MGKINIIHIEMHFNDKEEITAIELKLKSTDKTTKGNILLSTICEAFAITALPDEDKIIKTKLNLKRANIADVIIPLRKNVMSIKDALNFIDNLQKSINVVYKKPAD